MVTNDSLPWEGKREKVKGKMCKSAPSLAPRVSVNCVVKVIFLSKDG